MPTPDARSSHPAPVSGRRRRKLWCVPAQFHVGRMRMSTPAASFWFLAPVTLATEAVAGGAWHHLVGRSIYNPFALSGATEIALFVATLLAAHLALLAAVLSLLKRLFGRRWGEALLGFNFLFLGLAAWGLILLVRMMAARWAEDVPELGQLQALAGGHLAGGLGYVRSEILAALTAATVVAGTYLLARLLFSFDRTAPAAPAQRRGLAFTVATGGATVLLLFASARMPDVRDALVPFAAPRLAYGLLDTATDFDRDGYGLVSIPADEAPFDAARHPFALDVPDDGIDQDGLAGDFHASAPPPAAARPVFAGHRKHVVLIVLESTRGDAIGKRWRGVPVAPNLDRLAGTGSSASEAYSNQANTGGSMKVIFGGDVSPLPAGGSLFADFRDAGYRVGILSSQTEDWGGTAAALRMRENAHIFLDARSLAARTEGQAVATADGDDVLRAFDRSLGNPGGWKVPTFLYLNFQYAHFPYAQPGTRQLLPGRPLAASEISAAHADRVAGAYWNAVANSDRAVGAVIARLKALGVWDDTVLAVVGDHGEELFEEGHVGHGLALNRRALRIPFVLSVPGIALPRPVGLADLRAILLRAAGADTPAPRGGPVFHFLGTLEQPFAIGMTEAGGATTTLSLRDGHVLSSAPAAGGRYPDLLPGTPLRAKADRLATLWAEQRWQHRPRPAAAGAGRGPPRR